MKKTQSRGGDRVRDWLREKGLTQQWLADQIGTRQSTVSAWILGRPIPLRRALDVARVTQIPIEELADDSAPRRFAKAG